jgi:hypothetical protein
VPGFARVVSRDIEHGLDSLLGCVQASRGARAEATLGWRTSSAVQRMLLTARNFPVTMQSTPRHTTRALAGHI